MMTQRPKINLGKFLKGSIAIALFVFVFLMSHARGATPDEYKRSLETAKSSIEDLLAATAAAEAGEPSELDEAAVIEYLRNLLPTSEKINYSGGTIETANEWFQSKLAAFEEEADTTKRAVILTETSERLSALADSIGEIETAAAPSKDADKQKLAEILRREEYQKPVEKTESVFERWLREFVEWFESLFPRPEVSPSDVNESRSLAYVVLVVVGVLASGLIGFGLYKFAPLFSPKFRFNLKAKSNGRVILGERIADDQSPADLFGEAEQLAREGNLRAAIRKGYIASLCELNDRKLIGLAGYKTNRDYLRDIRAKKGLFENMQGLTASFERHWYGSKTAEIADWDEFRQGYKTVANYE